MVTNLNCPAKVTISALGPYCCQSGYNTVMPEINISNSAGRDAVVTMETVTAPQRVRWLDDQGRQASTVRVLKATIDLDIDALVELFGSLADVGQALVDGDPEVDLETTGGFLENTSRVYINGDREIVHRVQLFDVIRNPDGTVRNQRPRDVAPPNVSADVPLRWSGRLIDKSAACRRFVFSTKMQLTHINGLTYDFLFAMARELDERKSLMVLGGGPRSTQPLVLRRGALPYRGFLEGRVDGQRYALVLHLSNLELRIPEADGGENGEEEGRGTESAD